MSKYNINSLKEKIIPRNIQRIQEVAAERFNKADETLGMANEGISSEEIIKQPSSSIVRKTFSIPLNEIILIEEIKEKALDKRVVLSESEVIRIALSIAAELNAEILKEKYKALEKTIKGRIPKHSKVSY